MEIFNDLARGILEKEGFTVEENRAVRGELLIAKYSRANPKKRHEKINEYLLYYNGVRVGKSNGVLKDILKVLKVFLASDHRPEPQVKPRGNS